MDENQESCQKLLTFCSLRVNILLSHNEGDGTLENNTKKEESVAYIAELKPVDKANFGAKMIVCDMCGHANPEFTALCQMCSNYLTVKEVKK